MVLMASWPAAAQTTDTTEAGLSVDVAAGGGDTALITAPPALSPDWALYLLNPSSPYLERKAPILLDLPLDPMLATLRHNDKQHLRQRFAIEQMGQSVVGHLQREQQQMQHLGVLNLFVSGFVWGMIIKDNIESYIEAQQPLPPPPPSHPSRPPELRRP
jgi:hypothetical protein